MKKVVSLIDLKVMKTRNDCEIACDCVKRANVVLHVGLCEEIFARKHTATHKPTNAQPLSAPHSDQRDIHLTRSLVAWSPAGFLWKTKAPKLLSDWTSVSISEKVNISWGQWSVDAIFTCVELHDIVPVSTSINMLSVTDFVRKGIISGVRVQAGLHLDMLEADRSPNMQSAFLPELHRWISKLTARQLHACPPGDLSITMVKESVILNKKRVSKNEKKSYLSLMWKRWKREMTAKLPVTASSLQTWFYM